MNSLRIRLLPILALLAAPIAFLSPAVADPIDGRDILKFSQQPMDGTEFVNPNGETIRFWGHDELSTAYSQISATGPTPYRGTFMADDFADRFKSPVVHVKWWGSYLNNVINTTMPVNKFLISFERDVPDPNPTNPNDFSHPGEPLLNQIVRRVPVGGLTPGSGTYTEVPISPGGPPRNETLYEYNAELHLGKEFFQDPDTVYWLKIVALVDLPPGTNLPNPFEPPTNVTRWGWHNRDYTIFDPLASQPNPTPPPPGVVPGERIVGGIAGKPIWHFQDDAVTGRVNVNHLIPMGEIMPRVEQGEFEPTRYITGVDGPPPIGEFSKDLAFELYTIPEPTTAALMLVGLAGTLSLGRRSRSA
jgi:hypothetical protein